MEWNEHGSRGDLLSSLMIEDGNEREIGLRVDCTGNT